MKPRRMIPAGLFAAWLLVSGCAAQKAQTVTPAPSGLAVRVEKIPAYTPPGVSIYIAGNFNGWNPGDTAFRLRDDGKGGHVIVLPENVRGPIEFKFTLGSWDAVEIDSAGNDIQNRSAVVQPGSNPVLTARVAGWRDPRKKRERAHTARPTVSVISEEFEMPQLGRKRRVWVYLPPDYAASSARYPVLYMHDGQNVFDDATSFVGEWGVDETLDSLKSLGDRDVIVVAVDHGDSKRFDEYSPWKNAKYGGGEGDRYVEFLVKTLKPYIDSHYRTLSDRLNTGIAGSSMGGLISLYAVLKHPEVFGRGGIFSPAFWVAPEFHDLVRSSSLPSDVRLYFVVGAQEGSNPSEFEAYVKDQERIVAALIDRGLRRDSNIVAFTRPDGKHSEWFWRREFPAVYQWMFRK